MSREECILHQVFVPQIPLEYRGNHIILVIHGVKEVNGSPKLVLILSVAKPDLPAVYTKTYEINLEPYLRDAVGPSG